MAGVREDLILDITSAQRSIDRLESQVTAAFAGVNIEVDTAGVSQEITNAAQAADTNLRVTADTTGVASEISTAVDTANTDVNIGADTTLARAQVNALNQDLTRTTASAGALGVALSGAALLLGVRGLFSLAEASSAVNEQVTGSEIVFGNLAVSVQSFADQADRIGLAEAQALQLSNTFGQLAISAGLSDEAVATFATTIVARGADIASLRDIDLTQTLDALRSGLVGETEPLRNLGIFLNEAVVQAKAMELGLADASGEVDDAAKIQARYALILEQSQLAAGNFALTSDGLANTQRQVKAEIQDLAASAGSTLEPTFLRLAAAARDDLLPSLGELAQEALPAIGSILEDLAPVLGITLDLLVAAAPFLQVVADVLGVIPAPLVAAAAGYLLFNRAQRLATSASQLSAVRALGETITGVGVGVGKLNAATSGRLGTAAGLAGVVAIFPAIAVAADAGAGNVLSDLAGGVVRFGDSLTGFGARRADRVSEEIEDIIGALDTNDPRQALTAVERLTDAYDELDDVRRVTLGGVRIVSPFDSADESARYDQIQSQIVALNDQARAEIAAGLETGRFTDAQLNATFALANREGVASVIIRQLELLRQEEDLQARNGQVIIDKYEGVAAAYINVWDALGRLRTEAPEVEQFIAGIRTSGGSSEATFLGLAVAIDGANLSTEGLADTAALLGLNTNQLQGFVDGLTGSLDRFVDTAVGGLPTVGEVLGRVQEDLQRTEDDLAASQGRTARDVDASVAQFAAGLRSQADELGDFRNDLAAITYVGFSDIAGLIAEQGFEAGNGFADELAAAIEEGNVEVLDALRSANREFEDESMSTVAFIRDELAPQFLSATGILATAITETFTSGLDFGESVRIAGGLAAAELDPQAEQIAALAAVKGEEIARDFGAALHLDQAVIDAGVAAGLALESDEFKATVDGAAAGVSVGNSFFDGFIGALIGRQPEADEAAARVAESTAGALAKALGVASPSRVAREIGGFFMEGFTLGITDRSALAVGASIRAAGDAAAGLASQVPAVGTRAFSAQPSRNPADDERLAGMIAERIANAMPPQPLASFTLDGSKRADTIARESVTQLKAIERRARR